MIFTVRLLRLSLYRGESIDVMNVLHGLSLYRGANSEVMNDLHGLIMESEFVPR